MGLEIFAGRGGCVSVLGHAGAPAGRSSRPAGPAVRVAGRTRCPKGGPPPSSSPSTFLISASSGPGSGSGRRRLGYTGRQPVSGSDQPRPAVRRGPGGGKGDQSVGQSESSHSAEPPRYARSPAGQAGDRRCRGLDRIAAHCEAAHLDRGNGGPAGSRTGPDVSARQARDSQIHHPDRSRPQQAAQLAQPGLEGPRS